MNEENSLDLHTLTKLTSLTCRRADVLFDRLPESLVKLDVEGFADEWGRDTGFLACPDPTTRRPFVLQGLTKLVSLRLSSMFVNRRSDLPGCLASCPELKHLLLDNIGPVPHDAISRLTQLTALSMNTWSLWSHNDQPDSDVPMHTVARNVKLPTLPLASLRSLGVSMKAAGVRFVDEIEVPNLATFTQLTSVLLECMPLTPELVTQLKSVVDTVSFVKCWSPVV